MRVGVIQSGYAPWRGYFDFIASVDLFVLFDDVQYPKGRSWRNRNRVKTGRGPQWMTVPVAASGLPTIDQVEIARLPKPWRTAHLALITESLRKAPYFHETLELWKEGVRDTSGRLSPLNARLIRVVCEYLEIRTRIVNAREYAASGTKTERLINLLKKLDATCYLSGPAARDYLKEDQFFQNAIRLEYKTYDYPSYPQQWGEFDSGVTVLDLIANVGPEAPQYIRSQTPDVVAVP